MPNSVGNQTWLESAVYDWRHAMRGLRRDWTFTLAAVAMLALAIALNTATFTVMSATVYRGGDRQARARDAIGSIVSVANRRRSGAEHHAG